MKTISLFLALNILSNAYAFCSQTTWNITNRSNETLTLNYLPSTGDPYEWDWFKFECISDNTHRIQNITIEPNQTKILMPGSDSSSRRICIYTDKSSIKSANVFTSCCVNLYYDGNAFSAC